VASEYRNLGIPFEDLLNEGNLGLIEAANRFDVSKDTKFISYAVWWIRKTVLKALADHANTVRIPPHKMKKVREIRDAERGLRKDLGRKPTRVEISKQLSQDVTKVDEVLQISLHGVSLDTKVGKNEDRPLSEFLRDEKNPEMEEDIIHRQNTSALSGALEILSEQERTVLARRFGLDGEEPMTLQTIGKGMGVSRERVRQIENKAKAALLRYFQKRDAIPSLRKDSMLSRMMMKDRATTEH
jgi:RNA polymerase sigma factor (sigma-70 family)